MERRKFLQTGLLASVLAALFPRLIQSEIGPEGSLSPMSSNLSKDSPDPRMYPMTPDECFYAFVISLTNVYDEISISFWGITEFGREELIDSHDPRKPPDSGVLDYALKTNGYYRTIVVKYSYSNSIGDVNLYIPVKRFKDGVFAWRAARCIKNSAGSLSLMTTADLGEGMWIDIMEGPFDRPGFVIEHWHDRVDIHLAT